jgi:hypothetical protein
MKNSATGLWKRMETKLSKHFAKFRNNIGTGIDTKFRKHFTILSVYLLFWNSELENPKSMAKSLISLRPVPGSLEKKSQKDTNFSLI